MAFCAVGRSDILSSTSGAVAADDNGDDDDVHDADEEEEDLLLLTVLSPASPSSDTAAPSLTVTDTDGITGTVGRGEGRSHDVSPVVL